MHLISTNCLKDPTLLEPTYDAAILSENMNSQVLGDSGTRLCRAVSISVTAPTPLDSTSNTARSATPKLYRNFYLPNSGVQKTQGFSLPELTESLGYVLSVAQKVSLFSLYRETESKLWSYGFYHLLPSVFVPFNTKKPVTSVQGQ